MLRTYGKSGASSSSTTAPSRKVTAWPVVDDDTANDAFQDTATFASPRIPRRKKKLLPRQHSFDDGLHAAANDDDSHGQQDDVLYIPPAATFQAATDTVNADAEEHIVTSASMRTFQRAASTHWSTAGTNATTVSALCSLSSSGRETTLGPSPSKLRRTGLGRTRSMDVSSVVQPLAATATSSIMRRKPSTAKRNTPENTVDDDASSAAVGGHEIRSWHELKAAGENQRVNDELVYAFDSLEDATVGVNVHRYDLLDLTRKCLSEEFSRRLCIHGFLPRLLNVCQRKTSDHIVAQTSALLLTLIVVKWDMVDALLSEGGDRWSKLLVTLLNNAQSSTMVKETVTTSARRRPDVKKEADMVSRLMNIVDNATITRHLLQLRDLRDIHAKSELDVGEQATPAHYASAILSHICRSEHVRRMGSSSFHQHLDPTAYARTLAARLVDSSDTIMLSSVLTSCEFLARTSPEFQGALVSVPGTLGIVYRLSQRGHIDDAATSLLAARTLLNLTFDNHVVHSWCRENDVLVSLNERIMTCVKSAVDVCSEPEGRSEQVDCALIALGTFVNLMEDGSIVAWMENVLPETLPQLAALFSDCWDSVRGEHITDGSSSTSSPSAHLEHNLLLLTYLAFAIGCMINGDAARFAAAREHLPDRSIHAVAFTLRNYLTAAAHQQQLRQQQAGMGVDDMDREVVKATRMADRVQRTVLQLADFLE